MAAILVGITSSASAAITVENRARLHSVVVEVLVGQSERIVAAQQLRPDPPTGSGKLFRIGEGIDEWTRAWVSA